MIMDNNEIPQKNSTRHHYIPQFLINGFAHEKGLYVYDKQRDIILKNKRPSKSIFFENDRNTMDLPANKATTIIEDLFYREIDNNFSKVIIRYQNVDLKEIKYTYEETSAILFFKISLFWRIPRTDKTAEDVIDRAEIITGGEKAKELKLNSGYRKLLRSGLFQHHIQEITKNGIKGEGLLNFMNCQSRY